MIPTFFTTLAVGTITTMVASIMALSAWISGSQILQGNLFFDTTNNQTPAIYVNTTKVLTVSGSTTTPSALTFDSTNNQASCLKYGANFYSCYQEKAFTNTGASVGAGTYYNVVSITKPYSGSGSIKKIEVNCDQQGVQTNFSLDQTASLTASGTGFFSRARIGSGVLLAYGSGGGILWREDAQYIKGSSSALVGANNQCMLRVWSSGNYNP